MEEYISKQGLLDILWPLEPKTYGDANDLYLQMMAIIQAFHGVNVTVEVKSVKKTEKDGVDGLRETL